MSACFCVFFARISPLVGREAALYRQAGIRRVFSPFFKNTEHFPVPERHDSIKPL
jgi:hypothetical protein